MTVAENTNPINSITANGATTVVAYGFTVLDEDDITIAIDGVVQTSGFVVTGVGVPGGGTVVFATAPANGSLVVLYLDPALKRETDYQQFGDWLAPEVNRDFDRIWLALQGANKRIDASMRVSLSDYENGLNTELPAPQGGYALGWAADALSLINIALSTGTSLVNLAAATGASLVGWIQSGIGAVLRSVTDKLRERRSPEDYGCIGDGVVDDWTNLVKAVTACSVAGHVLEWAAGKTYRITQAIACPFHNVNWIGNVATLHLDDATGLLDHVICGDGGATQYNSFRFKGLVFTREQVATAGAAIRIKKAGLVKLNDLRIYGNNKIYNAVEALECIHLEASSDCFFDYPVNAHFQVEGTDLSAGAMNDLRINGGWYEGGKYGILSWDFVLGMYVDKAAFYGQTINNASLSSSVPANAGVSFKFRNTDFDSSEGIGLYIKNIKAVSISAGSWFSNNGGGCLYVDEGTDNVIVGGGIQMYPRGTTSGIVAAGANLAIGNVLIAGGGKNIDVRAVSSGTVVSGAVLNGGEYGVYSVENPPDLTVVGTTFKSHSISPTADAVAPNARVFRGNVGDQKTGFISNVAVPASPATIINNTGQDVMVYVAAGTVSSILVNGTACFFQSNVSFWLREGHGCIITYTAPPFVVFHRM